MVLLIGNGADVNQKDNDWWTPLHCAASAGNWRIVNMLITAGANVAVHNSDGEPPHKVTDDAKVPHILPY